MKKVLLSLALVFIAQFVFSQCDGVVLLDGSSSFKKFTNGMQVHFDYCGAKEQLVKYMDATANFNGDVSIEVENDPQIDSKYNCVITIRGDVNYEYATKILMAIGIENVTKNGKKLSQSDANNWYK